MTNIKEHLRQVLRAMETDLKQNRLEVGLAPAPVPNYHGHMIRVVQHQNPWWYQELCNRYPRFRRSRKLPDTKVKRDDILAVIHSLLKFGHSRSKYAADIVELAQEELWRWEDERAAYEGESI